MVRASSESNLPFVRSQSNVTNRRYAPGRAETLRFPVDYTNRKSAARETSGRRNSLPETGICDYFLGGAITSFAALATRNFTTVFALILIASPV